MFAVIRDRYGYTQLQIAPDENGNGIVRRSLQGLRPLRSGTAFQSMLDASPESVVCVWGTVQARPESMENEDMATGAIEVLGQRLGVHGCVHRWFPGASGEAECAQPSCAAAANASDFQAGGSFAFHDGMLH